MRMLAIIGMTLVLVSTIVGASESTMPTSEIVARQRAIRSDIESKGGSLESLSPATREKILADQDKLFSLVEGRSYVSELSQSQQDEVFNLIEAIAATVENADDERLVCTRETKVGTNMITKVCRSVGQIRENKKRAEETLGDARRSGCTGNGLNCY